MPETLRFDPKTYDWMQDHKWAEITVTKCDKCGMHYKPDLGHVCDKLPRLEFNRWIGSIEVRACPADLGMPCNGKPMLQLPCGLRLQRVLSERKPL